MIGINVTPLEKEKQLREETVWDEPITAEEVKRVLQKSSDTASGPDGVQYLHIKELPPKEITSIVREFNKSVSAGMVQEDWLHNYLRPLPMPGRNQGKIDGYRVITMHNVYGKLLKKVIARRIAAHLEKWRMLPNTLGSYRVGKGTCDNIAVFAFDVYEGFQAKM
jgi:hypothetical protein